MKIKNSICFLVAALIALPTANALAKAQTPSLAQRQASQRQAVDRRFEQQQVAQRRLAQQQIQQQAQQQATQRRLAQQQAAQRSPLLQTQQKLNMQRQAAAQKQVAQHPSSPRPTTLTPIRVGHAANTVSGGIVPIGVGTGHGVANTRPLGHGNTVPLGVF